MSADQFVEFLAKRLVGISNPYDEVKRLRSINFLSEDEAERVRFWFRYMGVHPVS